jgi:WD40 repeat protein
VIDFGIAKATTGQRLTDKTVFTAFEQFIGTPAYMSPEQAMMTSLDIDTRTDIYALGRAALRIADRPHAVRCQELMAAGLDAMRRIIREQEPARPSTRLSTLLAAELTTVARHRHAEPARLGTLLRGDLDWIVMKALTARERSHARARGGGHETANGLAADGAGSTVFRVIWASAWKAMNRSETTPARPAFSPNGRRVAIGHKAGITCFDLSTGQASHRWEARDRVYSMDFHPDNHRLAAGYYNSNVVSIYHADDGGHGTDLPLGVSSRTVVAWHPDGELLATGGSDARIQIWNVKTRRTVAVLEGHAGHVIFLMFHWNGGLLASMSWDGGLRLWQPSPGRLLMRLPARVMGFSREGRWAGVISPSNHHAQLWGIIPSQEYHTFLNTVSEGENVLREGDISPDGRLLALGTTDGVRLWDVARGREVAWLRLGDTVSVLFRDEGRELLTCGPADGLRRWRIEASAEPEGGRQVGSSRQINLPFAPTRFVKSRDDRTLAIVGEGTGQSVILDLTTESVRSPGLPHFNAGFIALSPDAERVASSGWHSDRVKVWDRRRGTLIKELETNSTSIVFFTPDNRELIVAREKEFTFHDRNSLEVSRRLPREVGLFPGHVAFTGDGKLMALEMAPGVIHLRELASGRTVARLEDPHGDHSTWMSFTPDGTQLVVAARYAGAIHRWDLRAIRARLKAMNLDWDWPEFAALSPGDVSFTKSQRPLRVQVVDAPPVKP